MSGRTSAGNSKLRMTSPGTSGCRIYQRVQVDKHCQHRSSQFRLSSFSSTLKGGWCCRINDASKRRASAPEAVAMYSTLRLSRKIVPVRGV